MRKYLVFMRFFFGVHVARSWRAIARCRIAPRLCRACMLHGCAVRSARAIDGAGFVGRPAGALRASIICQACVLHGHGVRSARCAFENGPDDSCPGRVMACEACTLHGASVHVARRALSKMPGICCRRGRNAREAYAGARQACRVALAAPAQAGRGAGGGRTGGAVRWV